MNNLQKELTLKRKKYVREWENDAVFFYENKLYDWMCEKINTYKNVIEIGCGTGYSTLALVQNGHQVIAIDENIECLKKTKETLGNNGVKAKIIKREAFFKEYKDYYEYSLQKVGDVCLSDMVYLIEGDIINDPKLEEWLNGQKIDCIVTWLIGSHGAMRFNKNVAEFNINTPLEYRLFVQHRVFEIADRVLSEDGALHIVDRGKYPENEKEELEYYQDNIDLAEGTALTASMPECIRYRHKIDGGIKMCRELEDKVVKYEELPELALISSLAVKSSMIATS